MKRFYNILGDQAEKILSEDRVVWRQRAPVSGTFLVFNQLDIKKFSKADGQSEVFRNDFGLGFSYTSDQIFSGLLIGGYSKQTEQFNALAIEDEVSGSQMRLLDPNGSPIEHGLTISEQDLIVGLLATAVMERISIAHAKAELNLTQDLFSGHRKLLQ